MYEIYNIITPAKVGTRTMLRSLSQYGRDVTWSHSISFLKKSLLDKSNKKKLIITGVRNIIDRNVSYFFQTYRDNFRNKVELKSNDYRGDYCFVPELKNGIDDNNIELAIEIFLSKPDYFLYDLWIKEFLEITKIKYFNKEKKYQLYNLENNIDVLIFRSENVNYISEDLCKILNIEKIINDNVRSEDKIYKKFKEKIVYSKKFIEDMLTVDSMKFFYTDTEINNFKLSYNTY